MCDAHAARTQDDGDGEDDDVLATFARLPTINVKTKLNIKRPSIHKELYIYIHFWVDNCHIFIA